MKTDPNEKVRQQFDLMPYPNLPASQMGGMAIATPLIS